MQLFRINLIPPQYDVTVCQAEKRPRPEWGRHWTGEVFSRPSGPGLILLAPPPAHAHTHVNQWSNSPLCVSSGWWSSNGGQTGCGVTRRSHNSWQHSVQPDGAVSAAAQLLCDCWVLSPCPDVLFLPWCVCWFCCFQIVSCFSLRIACSELISQQIRSPQAAFCSCSLVQQYAFREEGTEGSCTEANELICSPCGCLCPVLTQMHAAPLNTIKYWQLRSKLHLWFGYWVSGKGNPRSAPGTALFRWIGNISDSHQSLLISNCTGDKSWKWKCSCHRAGVETNGFSTDARGSTDDSRSPVSRAGWSWFPLNLILGTECHGF